MSLVPLDIPPGLYANGTDLQAAGRWRTGNLIRWENGVMEPVGGWQKQLVDAVTGAPRAIHAWRYGFTARRGAIGTSDKLYRYDGLSVADITPAALPAGRSDTVVGAGWGTGAYGAGTYGTARADVVGLTYEASTWALDNFGDDLVAVRRDEGTLWKWTPETDTTAIAITNAPQALGLLVTDERHLVAFGAGGDPRKVAWCDREDYTTWAAAATNSAGDLLLSTTGQYMGSIKSRYGVLILTDLDAHVLRYVGQPYVYGLERKAGGCGLFGPQAVAATEIGAVWMGPGGFHVFDGYVKAIPCEVYDRVFNDINTSQAVKITAGVNADFNEIWWFYPSAGTNENDRYVLWNYQENHWSFGALQRTAWADHGVFDTPLALDVLGNLYRHETGWTDNGSARTVYVESAPVAIGEGERIARVSQFINDEDGDGYTVTAYTRFTPSGTESTWGPYTMRSDGYTDVRFSGRQVRLRFDGVENKLWRIGKLRAEVKAGGRR